MESVGLRGRCFAGLAVTRTWAYFKKKADRKNKWAILYTLCQLYFGGDLSHKYQFLVLLPTYQPAKLKCDCLSLAVTGPAVYLANSVEE